MKTRATLIYKRKKLISCLCMFLLIISISLHPNAALSQTNILDFKIDFSRYRTSDTDIYVEIYYSFARIGLEYQKTADGYQAGCLIRTFIQKGQKAMLADSLVITDAVGNLADISKTQKFTEQTNIRLAPGEYKLISQLTDFVSKKTVTETSGLNLTSFSTSRLSLSDVQLASNISAHATVENKFDKNGLRVMPNPAGVYGTGFSKLFYYTEVYNLKYTDGQDTSTFQANYTIENRNGKIVKEATGNPRKKPGSSGIVHGAFDLAGLVSGFYTFQIQIIDNSDNSQTAGKKEFSIYKAEDFIAKKSTPLKTITVEPVNEFDNYSEFELQDHFDKVSYIATKEEKKIFKKLDTAGKKNFLDDFWKRRDPNPDTILNERKQEYFKFIAIANSNYSQGMKEGWKTDRGRVLLVYGKPDEVERFPSDTEFKTYEIWHYYDIIGGVQFYFVDFRRTGELMLVHSTHPDEVQQYDWQNLYGRL